MRKLGGKRAIKGAEVNNSTKQTPFPNGSTSKQFASFLGMVKVTLQTAVTCGDAASDTPPP